MPEPNIILLDGPKGAGKTTVSHILVRRMHKTNALSLDEERRALSHQEKTRTELNNKAFEVLLEKAKRYVGADENVVIDCGLIEERMNHFENLAKQSGATLHRFFLNASYEILLDRVRGRDREKGKQTNEARFKEVFEIIHSKDLAGFQIIETEKMSPEAIADTILLAVRS